MSTGHPLREWGANQTAACSFRGLLTLPGVAAPLRILLFLQPDVTPLLKSASHIWLPDVELDLHESG